MKVILNGRISLDVDNFDIDLDDDLNIIDYHDIISQIKSFTSYNIQYAIHSSETGEFEINDVAVDTTIVDEYIDVIIDRVEFSPYFSDHAIENGFDVERIQDSFKGLELSKINVSNEYGVGNEDEQQAVIDEFGLYIEDEDPELASFFDLNAIESIDYTIVKKY